MKELPKWMQTDSEIFTVSSKWQELSGKETETKMDSLPFPYLKPSKETSRELPKSQVVGGDKY